jgi:MFS family permease
LACCEPALPAGWLLLLARTLTGLTDCLSTSPGIIYISEVAETRLRGTFLNTCALASGLGIAMGYLVHFPFPM